MRSRFSVQLAVAGLLASVALSAAQDEPPASQQELDDQLQTAARAGDAETVQALLDQGADPDSRNSGGFTAVTRAAAADSIETVKVLADAGADIDAFNRNLTRPIGWAILNSNHPGNFFNHY